MIKVMRPPGSEPKTLLESTELKRLKDHKRKTGAYAGFEFRDYKADDVKAALRTLFNEKCAYCEIEITRAPIEVEHYRPKGRVTVGGKEKPGYWWLGMKWINLLPSCIDCNRERERVDANEKRYMAGKKDLFPLEDEKKRAKRPGQELDEAPVLLNPCDDEPSKHLRFPLPHTGAIQGVDPRGEESIRIYGLSDKLLTQKRTDALTLFNQIAKRVANIEDLRQMPDYKPCWEQLIIAPLLRSEGETLLEMIKPSKPFLAMLKPLVDRLLARISQGS